MVQPHGLKESPHVVTDAEPAGPRWPLLPKGMEIEARVADGSVVTLPR